MNRNRVYKTLGKRIADTYAADSRATLRNSLRDPYVKAFRWASDRLKELGVVAFVSNSGFLDGLAADGMRKHLAQDFDAIYVLDLGGNVRKNPKLSGSTHNVFGIQVGVSVNLLIRNRARRRTQKPFSISYLRVGESDTKEAKYGFLDKLGDYSRGAWTKITPDSRFRWLKDGSDDFESFVAMGSKEAKAGNENSIFPDLL